MRLESFRIRNCFGFVDSGEIYLGEPGNLVYFLGRNSSGKTSVLRAVSCLEYGQVPAEHPRFENYEPSEKLSFIRGKFSVNPSDDRSLSVAHVVNEVMQQFASTPVRVRQEEDGSFVGRNATGSTVATVALLNHVIEVYSDLLQRILEGGGVLVAKLGGGSYQFHVDGDSGGWTRRRDSLNEHTTAVRNAFTREGVPFPAALSVNFIEGLLFKQFPEIFFFTDRFSLGDDLPSSIRENHLSAGQNALTGAFISLLGESTVRALLRANGLARIESLTADLQGKLDALCEKINDDASLGSADASFVRIYVDRANDVRIVLRVDGKESRYHQISDATKFLIAYHIFQEDRNRKNALNSVLLFDEPNQGFHPSAETKILRFLESLAEMENQVLVATHSQYLIDLDRLTAVRVMTRAEDETLFVDNSLYGASGANRDTLALQPVTDAIGLHYADQLVTRDKVVATEGYTELLYLRLFARLLGHDSPNLAPVTGEGKMLTFIPFLISQGISFKVVLDSSRTKENIREAVPVSNDSFFIVRKHLGPGAGRTVGIEDLFSKDDFKMLLDRCSGHTINDRHLSNVTNSEYAKSAGAKALVAREAYESNDLDRTNFSEETTENFEALLTFCENDDWYRA